jgi:hypothetical protein
MKSSIFSGFSRLVSGRTFSWKDDMCDLIFATICLRWIILAIIIFIWYFGILFAKWSLSMDNNQVEFWFYIFLL